MKRFGCMPVIHSVCRRVLYAVVAVMLLAGQTHAVRIKDISSVKGVRSNQLVGYGLVIGLDGTGDDDNLQYMIQSFSAMLNKMGVNVKPEDIESENVAAVIVTAELPPFARAGSRIDVLVSSIGDAENLQGGTLLLTPLKAADGQIYAIAQGPVSTGGFESSRAGGAGIQKNFPTVGRVPGGALIEKEIFIDFNQKETLTFILKQPDFTTASRMAAAINSVLKERAAHTQDAGTITVKVPAQYRGNTVALATLIENLGVTPDSVSKVVINERTGTVIMGENVRISTVAIAHGNLSIEVRENLDVSQPLPFSDGVTTVVPNPEIAVQEGKKPLFLVESGVSIGEVVRALNALGVSPRDLIAIFQALKAAGALQADLEII